MCIVITTRIRWMKKKNVCSLRTVFLEDVVVKPTESTKCKACRMQRKPIYRLSLLASS